MGSSILVGRVLSIGFIEFFVFDYDSLPYLLSLFFWSGVTFPLVALDKIYIVFVEIDLMKSLLREGTY